jgi:hypothetical protein
MKLTSTPSSPQKKNNKKSAALQSTACLSAVDPDLRRQMIAVAAYYRAERQEFSWLQDAPRL